jgi:hypothetical protein
VKELQREKEFLKKIRECRVSEESGFLLKSFFVGVNIENLEKISTYNSNLPQVRSAALEERSLIPA